MPCCCEAGEGAGKIRLWGRPPGDCQVNGAHKDTPVGGRHTENPRLQWERLVGDATPTAQMCQHSLTLAATPPSLQGDMCQATGICLRCPVSTGLGIMACPRDEASCTCDMLRTVSEWQAEAAPVSPRNEGMGHRALGTGHWLSSREPGRVQGGPLSCPLCGTGLTPQGTQRWPCSP